MQIAIADHTIDLWVITKIFWALSYFDPSQITTIQKLCVLWLNDILNSGFTVVGQYWLAKGVVKLAWGQVKCMISGGERFDRTAWVSPLLGFLELCDAQEIYQIMGQPAPGALALQILSAGEGCGDFNRKILPILTSTLTPAHPLSSRRSALIVFHRFIPEWFSQMERIPNKDCARLLQAVGDPFQFTPDTTLQEEWQARMDDYKPREVVAILLEFASSDLWKNHLCHSNFASCEEVTSTLEGKWSMFYSIRFVAQTWEQLLCTPTKIITAIECLEQLQCLNTAEVVLMLAWSVGVVDSADHEAWRLIECKTLSFYQTHGTGRLESLSQCNKHYHAVLFQGDKQWNPQYQVKGVRLPVRIAGARRELGSDGYTDLQLAWPCQLRRLYQLFGCDPTTWEEVVSAKGVGGGVDKSLGEHLNPAHVMDCACDYP